MAGVELWHVLMQDVILDEMRWDEMGCPLILSAIAIKSCGGFVCSVWKARARLTSRECSICSLTVE